MEDQMTPDSTHESDEESRRYPFGLSSRLSFLVTITIGLIGPGLGVTVLEEANLTLAADIVWIVGYGTTILVVWFIWIRPLDIVGTDAQDWSERDDTEESDRASDTDQQRSEPSQQTDAPADTTDKTATNDQSEEHTERES